MRSNGSKGCNKWVIWVFNRPRGINYVNEIRVVHPHLFKLKGGLIYRVGWVLIKMGQWLEWILVKWTTLELGMIWSHWELTNTLSRRSITMPFTKKRKKWKLFPWSLSEVVTLFDQAIYSYPFATLPSFFSPPIPSIYTRLHACFFLSFFFLYFLLLESIYI